MAPVARLVAVFGWIALTGASLGCAGHAAGGPRGLTPRLPVTRVTLYQNGVGYFERAGKLHGNVLTLHCRPSQINDLLKSLTVIDRGSGRAVSVSLPLDKSGARVIDQLPKQVRNASGMLDVLRVFRGARVRVEGAQGSATGRVVGVEKGLLSVNAKKPLEGWRVTLKRSEGDLVVFPVATIRRLVLQDKALEVGLERSLDVSLEEGSWKPIKLSVRLAGGDDHDLLVSYIVEMPMWKPAYRLVLPEGRRPLLQGWAVVDNVSGESWRDVKLSLVAGTPMSFVYDLHRPRFTRRLDLTPRGRTAALAPPKASAGYDAKDRLQRRYASKRRAKKRETGLKEKPAADERSPAPEVKRPSPSTGSGPADVSALNTLLEKKVRTRVKGKQVGSLFRYELGDAVTVPDSSSTLVSIVNQRVSGEEVVLFRPELSHGYAAAHPYRAVRLKNDSGVVLEKGPVAIYSHGTFVGEGFLERLEKQQTIFLTYAIDGRVSLTRRTGHTHEPLRLLKIHGGKIVSEVLDIYRERYAVENHHDRPIVAYVKSKKRGGSYKLRAPAKETVRTAEASFVPVRVAAGQSANLKIEWVSPVKRTVAVDSHLASSALKMYLASGKVPPALKKQLDKVLAARARIGQLSAELRRVDRLKSTLGKDQGRVRENLRLLRKVHGNAALRSRLGRSLSKLEAKLSSLTAKYVKIDEERSALRREVRALIGQITLDATKK